MERLTERVNDGLIMTKQDSGDNVSYYWDWDEENFKVVEKLADYEDAEEQGLLVRLPCKVGDTVYKITRFCSGGIRDCGYSYECSECPEYKPFIEYIEFKITILKDIGKNVFLTREEAEKKLEEMKNDL